MSTRGIDNSARLAPVPFYKNKPEGLRCTSRKFCKNDGLQPLDNFPKISNATHGRGKQCKVCVKGQTRDYEKRKKAERDEYKNLYGI